MYVLRNTVARSHNHYFSGNTKKLFSYLTLGNYNILLVVYCFYHNITFLYYADTVCWTTLLLWQIYIASNENEQTGLHVERPTLHSNRRITLVDFQLDAQNSYIFTYNTFIKILYMFRALPCSSSGGLRRNCIYTASGIVTLCRWLSCAPVKKVLS